MKLSFNQKVSAVILSGALVAGVSFFNLSKDIGEMSASADVTGGSAISMEAEDTFGQIIETKILYNGLTEKSTNDRIQKELQKIDQNKYYVEVISGGEAFITLVVRSR